MANRTLLEKRLYYLAKKLKRAQKEFELIGDGDRVVLGVSGGKDSISLALLLLYYRRISPLHFDLQAVHVGSGQPEQTSLLNDFLQHHEISLTVLEGENETPRNAKNPCFICAWRRREALFQYCAAHNYNKLALAHHHDDAVETILMNLFFHGKLDTMEPRVSFFDGKIELIRPLVLTEEKEIRTFAKSLDFPFFTCKCGVAPVTERTHAKEILQSFGRSATNIKKNIWRASRRYAKNDNIQKGK